MAKTIIRIFKTWCIGVAFLWMAAGVLGCPASPPSGPEELPGPTALRFPSSVTVDLTTTTSGTFGALTLAKAFLGSQGALSDEINQGSDPIQFLEGFLDMTVSSDGILGGVLLDRSSGITSYSDFVPSTSGIFPGESLKIDFGRYVSSKTQTESCSGSTAGEPVCFRCWVSDRRICAGFMTTIPTETNDGAGFIWLDSSSMEELFGGEAPAEDERFEMGLRWDKSDTENIEVEGFFGGGLTSSTFATTGHFLLLQEGSDSATAKKTVFMTSSYSSFDGTTDCTQQYIGQWREDQDFWRGRTEFFCGSFEESVDACARLSTGEEKDASSCTAAGLSISGLSFIEEAAKANFAFPSSVPLTAPLIED